MLKIQLPKTNGALKVLFLGAHSDDIEIGCGGTILRLIQENPGIEITWAVFSALGERGEEARESAEEFLKEVEQKRIIVHAFKDGYFPHRGAEIKDIFEQLKHDFVPDVIFTHYRQDLHQDHRVLNELTWNTWRDHFILEYEIPKYDGVVAPFPPAPRLKTRRQAAPEAGGGAKPCLNGPTFCSKMAS